MTKRDCSKCQATSETLALCSQCKWTAYCSKTCQRDHWKNGHRRMCAKLKVCQRFRDLERQWWATRPTDELQTLVMQLSLQPKSMAFFGEVLFLLLGLKPCVLLSNLPPKWRQSFVSDVISTSGLVRSKSCAFPSIALYSVSTRLETPAEYGLTGDLVLGNVTHSEFALAERAFHLAVVDENVLLAATGMTKTSVVQEYDLARILDYPVALSECTVAAPMVEVGYFLEEWQGRVLLTSYCATTIAQHKHRIQQHFQRYQEGCAGLQLTLQTSTI